MITQAPNHNRRMWTDRVMRGLTVAATLLAMIPLALILGYVFVRGIGSFNFAFFTQSYKPPLISLNGAISNAGGILHGIVGSLVIVAAALLIAVPIGMLAGIFLAEYPANPVAPIVRFCTDVLSGAPSIIIGVVAYALIVQRTRQFSGIAGSIALSALMLPIIARTTEEILKLVPQTMREAALALGAPTWWLTLTVVIPTAGGGIITGVMLAFARASGETAPLLLTVLGNNTTSVNLFEPMAALPLLAYKYTDTPFPELNQLAWGTALVLTLLVLSINMLVRWLTRSRLR